MDTKESLLEELEFIHKWEKEQGDLPFWEKWGKIPFVILDKLTPKFVHDKLNKVLDDIIQFVTKGNKYFINERHTLKHFEHIEGKEEVKALSIKEMDKVAEKVIQSRKELATLQGASTGIGGIWTLGLDIPAVFGMSINVLQEMALCYGFDPQEEKERMFMVKCLQFASSDVVGKQTLLEEIKDIDTTQSKQTISQMKAWREVFTTYRDNLGMKKLFQMIPIAGIIFGSLINRQQINDMAEVGKNLYKKRRIHEKLKELQQEKE